MTEEKCIKDEKTLENVDGGSTWDPIDESCPVADNPDRCPFTSRRGHYDNCSGCRHFR